MIKNIIFALSSETAANTPTIEFNPTGFIDQLPAMGFGMLGIFIVIGIIVAATYLLNFIFKPRNKTPKK